MPDICVNVVGSKTYKTMCTTACTAYVEVYISYKVYTYYNVNVRTLYINVMCVVNVYNINPGTPFQYYRNRYVYEQHKIKKTWYNTCSLRAVYCRTDRVHVKCTSYVIDRTLVWYV